MRKSTPWALVLLLATALAAADAGRLEYADLAASAGLEHGIIYGGAGDQKYILESTGTGVAAFDYDNDGRPDLFFVNGTRLDGSAAGKNLLYHNLGGGRFEEVGRRAGVDAAGGGQGGCIGDFDNDGRTDVFVTYYGLNKLFRNNGDGTFTDVTHAAGIAPVRGHYALQPVAADLDEDGWPDLYVGCDATPNILYRNNRDGTFTDLALRAGVAVNSNGTAQATMGVD